MRDRILNNRLYRYVSTNLAGTQDYMAMEKLLAVKEDPRFDLIVLDTPPTRNALDFLEAPDRLVEALDGPAIRWFVEAFSSTRKFSLNFVAQGVAAVLKGLPQRQVVGRHVLRNSLLPTITVVSVQVGYLVGGLVVVETLFSYPGIGQLSLNAAVSHDLPVLEPAVLMIAIIYLVANFIADVLVAVLNPRVRLAT